MAGPLSTGEGPLANWTTHPIIEREITESRRSDLVARRWRRAFWFVSLGLCPFTCVGVGTAAFGDGLGPFPALGFVLLILLGVAAQRRTSKEADLARKRGIAFREEHAAVGGWIVEMTVFQGATPTGRDRGVAWFEDDLLLFAGRRTSFALAVPNVERLVLPSWEARDLIPELLLVLRGETAAGPVKVGFEVVPLESPTIPAGWGLLGFSQAVRGWLAAGGASGGQLPPLVLGPDAPSTRLLLARAVEGTVIWTSFVAVLATLSVEYAWEVPFGLGCLLVMLLMAWPAVWVPRLRWRAWRDRRRLEKAQWKT